MFRYDFDVMESLEEPERRNQSTSCTRPSEEEELQRRYVCSEYSMIRPRPPGSLLYVKLPMTAWHGPTEMTASLTYTYGLVGIVILDPIYTAKLDVDFVD